MDKKAMLMEWLDNTAPMHNKDQQGLLRFLKHWYPESFSKNWAEHHYLMTKLLWEMYNPKRTERMERQGYFIIHREAAKTTLTTFGFPSYFIWMKGFSPWVRYDADGWEGSDTHDYDIVKLPPLNEKVILILSETSTQSEYFVMNLRDNITTHKGLRQFFGNKETVILEEEDEESKGTKIWRRNAFRTNDGTMVIGKGAGQQVRGTNVYGSRPTMIFVDDMYSRNNTKTEHRLEDLNRWLFAEVSNSLDSEHGKLFWLGTIVHPQTAAQIIQGSDQWFGINRPVIGYFDLKKILDEHCVIADGKMSIPAKDKCFELQDTITSLSWPEKHSLFSILSLYKREFEQNNIGYFYREYMNMSEAPEEQVFDWDKLKSVKFTLEPNNMLAFDYDDTAWKCLANFTMAVDIASSEKATADDSVITICGYVKAIGQKFGTNSLREKIFPIILHIDGGRGWGIYKEEVNGLIKRKGIVNEMRATLDRYPVEKVYMESNATQESIRREAARALDANIFPVINTAKKTDRIKADLEPIWGRYDVILYNSDCHMKVAHMFKQLISLNSSAGHDDYCDAVSIAFKKSDINPQSFRYDSDSTYKVSRHSKSDDISRFGAKSWEIW
jgi:hypothetical protein